MKNLTVKTAEFAVVRTAFHGGGIVSLHISLWEAIKSMCRYRSSSCICGCAEVFPITNDAAEILRLHYIRIACEENLCFDDVAPSIHLDQDYRWAPTLLSDLRRETLNPFEYVI